MLPVSQGIAKRAPGVALSAQDRSRFSRHILLPEIGMAGQQRLLAARVLIVGTGGLGSASAYYLTAAGVGTIGLVDFDTVDMTNLQRQILFSEEDIGVPKLDAAVKRLRELCSSTHIIAMAARVCADNVEALIRDFDIVIDGTDNFPTRYLLSDACVALGKPYIYGSIYRFEGQTAVFYPPHGPCYRCLFPAPPPPDLLPSCAEGGVLGVLPGHIGIMQATETLKLICGIGQPLLGRLSTFEALTMRFSEYTLERDPSCPACGTKKTEIIQGQSPQGIGERSFYAPSISCQEYHQRYRATGRPHVLLDVRNPPEASIAAIEDSRLIPLDELPKRWRELPRDLEIIVYCKSGVRSARAAAILLQAGVSAGVASLEGGILAWIDLFAPELSRY